MLEASCKKKILKSLNMKNLIKFTLENFKMKIQKYPKPQTRNVFVIAIKMMMLEKNQMESNLEIESNQISQSQTNQRLLINRQLKWYVNNNDSAFLFSVPSVEGSNLVIPRVKRQHMGAYLCIASNGVPPSVSKRVTLIVHCKYLFLDDFIYLNIFSCSSTNDCCTKSINWSCWRSKCYLGMPIGSLSKVDKLLDQRKRGNCSSW